MSYGKDLSKSQEWELILQEWQQSGMSQAEFCRQHRLRANRFAYWKIALLRRAGSRKQRHNLKQTKEKFLPVTITNGESGISSQKQISIVPLEENVAAEIIDAASSRRLRIFEGASPGTIAAIVAVCFK